MRIATRTSASAGLGVAAGLAALVLLVLGASPALAQSEDQRDPARDTVAPLNGGGTVVQPRKYGDITGIATRFTSHRVIVTTTFRAIDTQNVGMSFRVNTPAADYRVRYDSVFGGGNFELVDAGGATVTCGGLSAVIDPVQDEVIVKVPPGCLGDARSVRTGATVTTLDPNATGSDSPFVSDDARRRARVPEKSALGPTVRRAV